jgi:hypothetical protein
MGKKMKLVSVGIATITVSYVFSAILFMLIAMTLMNPTPRVREILLQPRTTGRRRGSLSDFTS